MAPSSTTRSRILQWINDIGLGHKLPKGKEADWHVTLMYDKSNPEYMLRKDPPYVLHTWTGVPTHAAVLGDNEWRSMVLHLESQGLQDRHEELVKLGYKNSYPEYKPHLSLWLEPDDDPETTRILNDNLDKLIESLPGGRFELNNEQWRRISE